MLSDFENNYDYEKLFDRFFAEKTGKDIQNSLEAIERSLDREYYNTVKIETIEMEQNILMGTFIGILIFIGIYIIIGILIIKPINRIIKLSKYIESIQKHPNSISDESTFDIQNYKPYPILMDDEIGDLVRNFNHFADVIITYNKNLEQIIAERTQALQDNQQKLLASEKMVALGQLVGGIAHELNTPSGAINAAIVEIKKDFNNLFDQFYTMMNELDKVDGQAYKEMALKLLLEFIEQESKDISTKEQRVLAKEMQTMLEDSGVDNARKLSKELVGIGLEKHLLEELMPLYKEHFREDIHKTFYLLGNSKMHLRDIHIGNQRIIHLVKALRNHTRKSNGEITQSNVINGIEETLLILNNKIKRGIQVTKEYQEIPLIKADFESLNQVWTNIINNAIQAMNAQGSLTIRVYEKENFVVVEIEDSGTGMSDEVKQKVFDPYFTTKPIGQGTGIGLNITKDIVEKQGGHIDLRTELGKGTCFMVSLSIESS